MNPSDIAYLSEALCLGVLLEAESWEMHSTPEDFCFGQDADTTHAINLHLHIRIAERISQIGQMRSPSSVLGIAFDDHCVFIEGVGQSEGSV